MAGETALRDLPASARQWDARAAWWPAVNWRLSQLLTLVPARGLSSGSSSQDNKTRPCLAYTGRSLPALSAVSSLRLSRSHLGPTWLEYLPVSALLQARAEQTFDLLT